MAHVFPPAADAVGEMVVTDLGIPPRLVDDVEEEAGDLHLLMGEELADLLPEREPDAHKGDFGHALIVAGSPGKAGACILAARAAVRAGAGLVTAAVPEPILQTVDLGSIESMTLALPAGASGHLAERAADVVLEAAEGKAVLALGPGLGQEPSRWRRSAASPWSARCRWCSTPTASTPSRARPATSPAAGRRRS